MEVGGHERGPSGFAPQLDWVKYRIKKVIYGTCKEDSKVKVYHFLLGDTSRGREIQVSEYGYELSPDYFSRGESFIVILREPSAMWVSHIGRRAYLGGERDDLWPASPSNIAFFKVLVASSGEGLSGPD